MVKTHQHIKFG